MKDILCYGDSNTWGFMPNCGKRYDAQTRWTGVLQQELGSEWRVHEDGLNARNSVFDAPYKPFLNGLTTLPSSLISQKPLDVLVISLGTNDLKTHTAMQSAMGVAQLVRETLILSADAPIGYDIFKDKRRIIVVSPIQVWEGIGTLDTDSNLVHAHEESTKFPQAFRKALADFPVTLIDAQQFAQPSHKDGVHMEPEGHHALGMAVAEVVRAIMAEA